MWYCGWFEFTGQVPVPARGRQVVLLIDLSGEGCVVDRGWHAGQGLTTVSSVFDQSLGKPGKKVVEVYERAEGNEAVDLWVEAGANDLFGSYQNNGILKEASIAVCNPQMRGGHRSVVPSHISRSCTEPRYEGGGTPRVPRDGTRR